MRVIAFTKNKVQPKIRYIIFEDRKIIEIIRWLHVKGMCEKPLITVEATTKIKILIEVAEHAEDPKMREKLLAAVTTYQLRSAQDEA
jgi:hypothetical protein